MTFGIDAHKCTHTVVVADDVGRPRTEDHDGHDQRRSSRDGSLGAGFDGERRWAEEDCRHLSRRLEADLLRAGEVIVQVPPKLMAHARDAAGAYRKSDPIDALAVARAALANPDLPVAQLHGPCRELRLMVDHREDLVAERTRCINRLRWHLHDHDPTWDPPARQLVRLKHIDAVAVRLAGLDGPVARTAMEIGAHARVLTVRETELEREIAVLVRGLAPTLLDMVGVGALTAAKIVAKTAECAASRARTRRPPQRHRPAAGVDRQPRTPSLVAYREPPTERGDPPHRGHIDPLP